MPRPLDVMAEIAFAAPAASAYLRPVWTMEGTAGEDYLYMDMTSVPDYTTQAGDYLEYDVWHESLGETNFVDGYTAAGDVGLAFGTVPPYPVDQNGLHVFANVDAYAYRKWYHRKFPLNAVSIGPTFTRFDLACDEEVAGTYVSRFRDIQITDGFGTVRKDIWRQVHALPTFADSWRLPADKHSFACTRAYEDPVWTDVTPWYLGSHPRRGRARPTERSEAGQMVTTFDNSDRRFDPENAGKLANYVLNPSFEVDTSTWGTYGINTLARSFLEASSGRASLLATYQNDLRLASCGVTVATPWSTIVGSARVWVPNSWTGGQITISDDGQWAGAAFLSTLNADMGKRNQWQTIWFAYDLGADTAGGVFIRAATAPAAGQYIYVDSVMVEEV